MVQETTTVTLKDDFYRDSFPKIITILLALGAAFGLLVALSLYLFLTKPKPVTFQVGENWRVVAPVPVDQSYVTTAELLQWVSEVFPKAFTYDFAHFNDQIKDNMKYFTHNGWQVFANQLNNYINYNTVQVNKLFISGKPTTVPLVFKEGVLSGRYAWWVTAPITLTTASSETASSRDLVFQVLVVRVPTTDNLVGMAIDNVVVSNTQQPQGASA